MTGLMFLIVIALVFAAIWIYLAQRPGPRAKIGPDGTNVRNPETFVVHHEGKAQGLDIANTALKERTEHLSRDLPGDAHQIKAAVPGRDMTKMDAPPSDVSKYGDEKVAPGAVPGAPGAETKAKVLMEGPRGSRPETPEEPGSPYAKGRRVTDIHRDVELAEEVLPAAFGRKQMDRDQAVSPATTAMEPGYGLGRTRPGETDGEGGPRQAVRAKPQVGFPQPDRRDEPDEEEEEPYLPVEQPEMQDHVTDVPGGALPGTRARASQTVTFHADFEAGEEVVTFRPDPQADWALLQEPANLPDQYGEDAVTAIVRNPRSLYVYWELSGGAEERLRKMLGEAAYQKTIPCLRVFDVETGASFPIDLGEQDDHWFINDLEPGHRYVITRERRAHDGRYYLLALSSPVSMPQEGTGGQSMLYQHLAQLGRPTSSPWR